MLFVHGVALCSVYVARWCLYICGFRNMDGLWLTRMLVCLCLSCLGCCLDWFAGCLGYLLDAYAVVLPGFRLFPAGLLGCCCLLFKGCVFILGWLLVWFVFAG